jgi:NAD(P)H-flavin reductase
MFMRPPAEEFATAGGFSDPMIPRPCRVEGVSRETQDTFTISLQSGDGSEQAQFAPGQFSMLYVFGVGELPVSISGDPEQTHRRAYTVRSVGQATQALVSRRPGDAVGVRGPFGTPWPLTQAWGKDVLIIAGGIGLAPLRPAVYRILRYREEYGRLILLYGARSPRDLLYRRELGSWSHSPDSQVLTTVDYGGVNWRGRVGVVTTLFRYLRLRPDRTVVLICGPEIMMRYVITELTEHRGVAASDIYLSMERNMKCAVGFCGHCQYGPHFICKDGPIFSNDRIRSLLERHEL